MKKQQLFLIAALAVFGCTFGTPLPANENEPGDEAYVETGLSDALIEKRAVYSSDCLDKLYIMAFTSGIANAQSDAGHSIEILANGDISHVQLYNRPGDDYLQNKGDLWKYSIADFFPFTCIHIGDIQRVYITEGSNDGWHIDSIVTLVEASGRFQLLTRNFDVNRWIDGNGHYTHRRFELTLA